MPNWFLVVVLVVGVLAIGLKRERCPMCDIEAHALQR
jgi:hypothetical protein